MARIDLLTAQMCRRAARRITVQSDEKMQFFGANGELLGTGAVLSSQAIHEFLLPIAPIPFDGVPVSFPYQGCDGEFKILVAAKCRGFEIHALSFAVAQTQANFPGQSKAGSLRTAFDCGWSGSGNSDSIPTKPPLPLNGVRPGTYEPPEEAPQDDTD